MRKFVAGLLAVLTMAVGVPVVTANGATASVVGQIVDAGGRGSAGLTVELLRDGAVVSSTVTIYGGNFTFSSIAPGNYLVRTTVNSRPAGVSVSLRSGESTPVLVVLPSMATASEQAQLAGLLGNLLTTVASTTLATVVTELYEEAQADEDDSDINEAKQSGEAVAVLQTALQQILTQNPSAIPPQLLQQILQEINQIANNIPDNIEHVNDVSPPPGSGAS
jgi:hypothetical protein